jgi:malate dehydrogenase (oxaloacetate-decarboxylating)(NADP+)
MVAVISNGTAILGLGNLGALASKPVMEGKAVLFKRFADVDSIDLELDTEDPDKFIEAVRYLGPSFGGINLEDIKAPECFIIEQRLQELMDIPVFHDDQHGTAIIAAAGLINASISPAATSRRRASSSTARAAGIACVELLKAMGFTPDNVILCDTKGTIWRGRTEGMNQWKSGHAVTTDAAHAGRGVKGADVFFGLSQKGALTPEMVMSMAPKPDHLRHGQSRSGDHAGGGARRARRRHRRDRPLRLSQPGQQRPRLPLPVPRRARRARHHHQHGDEDRRRRGAGGSLAREDVPDEVAAAYQGGRPRYGKDYIIPVPFDPRLIHVVPTGGRQGGDGDRRRPPADRRHGRLQGAAHRPGAIRSPARSPHLRARPALSRARRLRRGRGGAGDPRRPEPSSTRGSAPPSSSAARSASSSHAAGRRHRPRRTASRSPMRGSPPATPTMPASSTSACSARATCSATASA